MRKWTFKRENMVEFFSRFPHPEQRFAYCLSTDTLYRENEYGILEECQPHELPLDAIEKLADLLLDTVS